MYRRFDQFLNVFAKRRKIVQLKSFFPKIRNKKKEIKNFCYNPISIIFILNCSKYEYSGPYTGFHLVENFDYSGNNGMYRWYINDPIRFKKRIKWTIEHGHANNFENDYSSVAYWYQKEPHKRFPPFPEAEKRIPRFPENYDEIWSKYIDTAPKVFAARAKLKDKFPEDIDKLYLDATHDFMQGKYQIALNELEQVKSMIKNRLKQIQES